MAFQDTDFQAAEGRSTKALPDLGSSRLDTVYARLGKRGLDLALAVIMLPALIPVMALIWLMIRWDGGAALFSQPRVGRDGRIFSCFKFRTMVVDAERVLEQLCASNPQISAEWSLHQKLRDDPRITRVGRILRKTSLDELPQIINVFRGDMSLVGPRPFLPAQKGIYDAAGGRAYYRVRPGITGLWQVVSRHDTTFAARVMHDEAYGTEISLASDLSLLLRTVKVVLDRTGA